MGVRSVLVGATAGSVLVETAEVAEVDDAEVVGAEEAAAGR